MQLLEPIEAILPRRAQGYGEFIRTAAALLRAGLPVPTGYAMARAGADQVMAQALAPDEQLPALLDTKREFPSDAALADMARRVSEQAASEALSTALRTALSALRMQGARAVTVTAYLVCDKPSEERALGEAWLGIETEERLLRAVAQALAAPFEPKLLRSLRAADVRSASVALTVQRMVDGTISGIAYTRHPITGDPNEWLVRAGYGLSSAVWAAEVPSDSFRLSRDGYMRDRVIVPKTHMLGVNQDGERELRSVPEALVLRPTLDESSLRDVARVSERTERHFGAPVRLEWAIAQERVYLLSAEVLPGATKIPRARAARPEVRARELWSHVEVGEAFPDVLSPLSWSLLRRFERAGLSSTVAAVGAGIGASPELMTDVRGRPYLNLGALTAAVRKLPGLSAETLARIGFDSGPKPEPVDMAGPFDLSRALLRFYDSHAHLGVRFGRLSTKMAEERGHFAGLDARLLAPDAVERVLCDVELFLREAATEWMHVYGLWLVTLLAFRSLLEGPLGPEALRLERDLLWGPDELISAQVGHGFLKLARLLSREPGVLHWVEEGGEPPRLVRQSLSEFALKHRYDGMRMLDPMRPRWRETPERLEGALRALLGDPRGLAYATERHEVVRGRRERAEREWKRRVPLVRRPLVGRLIKRLRELTRHREQLLADTAQAIGVIREIAVDASRRLSMRYRDLGADAAFFLEVDELHAALGRGRWDVGPRVRMRQTEYALMQAAPTPVARFQGRPSDERSQGEPLTGVAGSSGAGEGRVFIVRHGDELAQLPPGAVLVVPACDVGMSMILPSVRAVVSEQGGMVSHGAMLASALGVPVVVGVPNAMQRLREGERVLVDAERREVVRLEGRA